VCRHPCVKLRLSQISASALMSFLHKQPSVLPRALCASLCPPENIYHDISDFPYYYDSLYFPTYYPFLFQTEDSTCRWLKTAFHNHLLRCLSCSSLTKKYEEIVLNITYSEPVFHFELCGICLQVPLTYIESSHFSFCRLYRRFFFLSMNLCSIPPYVDQSIKDIESVLARVPTWLMRPRDAYFPSLCALSLSELQSTPLSFSVVSRRKPDVIEALIEDFVKERSRLWVIVTNTCQYRSWSSMVVMHFFHRYGERVASVFRDLRSPDDFQDSSLYRIVSNPNSDNQMWLQQSFDDMSSKMTQIRREDVLRSLQSIPCHLRPTYDTHSIRACRSALLCHIRRRIALLVSFSFEKFLHHFFSVLPFYVECNSSREILTESILVAEYGDVVISFLHSSSKSLNVEQCFQRRQRKRNNLITDAINKEQKICSTWPSVVPDHIVFKCLNNYRHHTVWIPPLICCVCGLEHDHVEDVSVSNHSNSSLDFSVLQIKDQFILDRTDFRSGVTDIDNVVLEHAGLKSMKKDSVI
jgi:hypothetical protein